MSLDEFTLRCRVGRPSVAEANLRTETLLEKAAEVFIEHGYQRTSMEEIARRAGTTKQTLYARFPTKSDLFKEIVRAQAECIRKGFASALGEDEAPETALMRYAESTTDLLSRNDLSGMVRTLIGALPQFPEMASYFWTSVLSSQREVLTSYLAAQQRLGRLRIPDPREAAEFLEGLCIGPFMLPSIIGLNVTLPPSQQHRRHQEALRIFLNAYAVPTSATPSV